MAAARLLKNGERSLAQSVYGEGINLDVLELRNRKWWPLQPRNVVMGPCGHLHFHPASDFGRTDFSSAEAGLRGLFIHELCHVWQSQHGLFLPLRRPPFARYTYTLKSGKPLRSYGVEQQAEIVAQTYLGREGHLRMTREEQAQHEDLVSQLR